MTRIGSSIKAGYNRRNDFLEIAQKTWIDPNGGMAQRAGFQAGLAEGSNGAQESR
jgi:hypothetical protein